MLRQLMIAIAVLVVAVPSTGAAERSAASTVVIKITVVNGRPVGGINRTTVKKGQTVRFVIRTNAGSEIHLHGYEIEKKPRKGAATVMQFVAKVPGRFALELHDPDALLAQLTVRP